ncbi:hypothetical protein ACFLYE_03960 [Chloroflexota bacterium]
MSGQGHYQALFTQSPSLRHRSLNHRSIALAHRSLRYRSPPIEYETKLILPPIPILVSERRVATMAEDSESLGRMLMKQIDIGF